jgi:hypothetical protein
MSSTLNSSRRSNFRKVNSGRAVMKSRKPMGRLNSSKKIDEVTYYSLTDLETVIEAVLNEVAADPTVGITLADTEEGITLNCVTEEGEEYEVEVALASEDFNEEAPAAEEVAVEEEFDVAASRRSMNSNRSTRPARRPMRRR